MKIIRTKKKSDIIISILTIGIIIMLALELCYLLWFLNQNGYLD